MAIYVIQLPSRKLGWHSMGVRADPEPDLHIRHMGRLGLLVEFRCDPKRLWIMYCVPLWIHGVQYAMGCVIGRMPLGSDRLTFMGA